MKKSELKEYIREAIIAELSEAVFVGPGAVDDITKNPSFQKVKDKNSVINALKAADKFDASIPKGEEETYVTDFMAMQIAASLKAEKLKQQESPVTPDEVYEAFTEEAEESRQQSIDEEQKQLEGVDWNTFFDKMLNEHHFVMDRSGKYTDKEFGIFYTRTLYENVLKHFKKESDILYSFDEYEITLKHIVFNVTSL